jgi:hypothetical protein
MFDIIIHNGKIVDVRDVCRDTPPTLTQAAEGENVACHFPLNVDT